MTPYVVVAPSYRHTSGGIRATHLLCHHLNRLGAEAYIALYSGSERNRQLNTPFPPQDVIKRAIAVYPEGVRDNPLGCKHVVRWWLNRPPFLPTYSPDDYVVAYSRAVSDVYPLLTVEFVECELFHPNSMPEKVMECWWQGKAPDSLRDADVEHGRIEICNAWPRRREELAYLLRHSRLLVTYDTLTALTLEATLCGTPCVILPDGKYTKADLARTFPGMSGIAWGFDDRELEHAQGTVHLAYTDYLRNLDRQDEHLRAFITETQSRWS